MSDDERQLATRLANLSYTDLRNRTDRVEGYDKILYYLLLYLVNMKDTKSIRMAINILNNKIMDYNFPEEILYFYYQDPNLFSSFSNQARYKISSIGSNASNSMTFGVINKDLYLFRIKKDLLRFIGSAENVEETDLFPYMLIPAFEQNPTSDSRTDLSIKQNKKFGSRIIMPVKDELLPKKVLDKKVIYFGYYPQKEVSRVEGVVLDILFKNNLLDKLRDTERYTLNSGLLGKKSYQVYYANNRRFIKYNDSWIEVKPIRWGRELRQVADMKFNIFYTLDDLVGGLPSPEMRDIFCKEVFEGYSINRTLEQRKERGKIRTLEQEKRSLNVLEKKAEKDIEKQTKKEEIEDLFLEELKLLEEQEKSDKQLVELGAINNITYNRIFIDNSYLVKTVDNHYEFNAKFIPYLRFIDLSFVVQDNLKVSGLNFKNTNIEIDPQKVYGKDLSNSVFGVNNFNQLLVDFTDCNLSATDLSEVLIVSSDLGIDKAIVDNNTKLPNGYKDMITKRT